MKKPYIGVVAILAVAFAAFLALSIDRQAMEELLGLKAGSFEKTLFGAEVTPADTLADVPDSAAQQQAALDTTKKNILFIGDSMLEGLKPRLAAYAEENGHEMNAVIWYSSTTEIWATSGKVSAYIKQFKPDYIFISLGGNELFVSDIKAKRTKYVQQIVKEFGNIPYIWIGPPNWKDDTGFNEMVQSVVPKGKFYLSYTPDQHYDRTKDGAHPTRTSAGAWMDRVCKFVMNDSDHPIVLNVPQKQNGSCHTEMLQPAK